MGICENCKEKILYNRYKRYRGKILCPECYSTRLERKAARKAELKIKAAKVKIVTPSRKAKKAMKKKGLTQNFIPDDMDGHALSMDDVNEKTEVD